MNILDLKKGDKVFTGVVRTGNGFANNVEYIEEMEVRDIYVGNINYAPYITIRLAERDMVKEVVDGKISLTEDDFKDGIFLHIPTETEVIRYLAKKTGCQVYKRGGLIVWRWNEEDKIAEEDVLGIYGSIFRFALPDGCYPSKEACEKANKKMVTIEVTKIYMVEREEGEEAEHLLNNPDDFQPTAEDEDNSIIDARYAD